MVEIEPPKTPDFIEQVKENPNRLVDFFQNEFDTLKPKDFYTKIFEHTTEILWMDVEENGGFTREIDSTKPTIVVSDVHARNDFIVNLLEFEIAVDGQLKKVSDAIQGDLINVVFLGDYVHGEENDSVYDNDKDMRRSLNTQAGLAVLKSAFPNSITLLRGNHDDIYGGAIGNIAKGYIDLTNYTLSKLREGFESGHELIDSINEFEKVLPLVAYTKTGNIFSHAAPSNSYRRCDFEVCETSLVTSFTWTENRPDKNRAIPLNNLIQNADLQVANLVGEEINWKWFIGHRSVPEGAIFRLQGNLNKGAFIQIMNDGIGYPSGKLSQPIAILDPNIDFNPDIHVIDFIKIQIARKLKEARERSERKKKI